MTMEGFERILIPTDGSAHADLAVGRGLSLARLLKRPVIGIYVIDAGAIDPYPNEGWVVDLRGILEKEAAKVLQAFRQRAQAAGVAAEVQVLHGHPEEEIVKAAQASDLIVIATHGRRGLTRLLMGSVTENVVRHASCPVLVVRHSGG